VSEKGLKLQFKKRRNTMKTKILWLALVPILILMGSFSQAQETPRSGGTLNYATGTDALTLDPQFVTDVPTSRVVMQIH
jgi:ABC-type transport system substrate-binding protein